MGYVLFFTFLFLEIFLCACRIKTKTDLTGLGVLLRAGQAAALVILAAVSAVTWGLRYYALFALLALSAGAGIAKLIKKDGGKAQYSRARALRRTAAMAAALAIASLPAIAFPEYSEVAATGKYQVATETAYFTDENRGESYAKGGGPRRLCVEFWYPKSDAGGCPLIVFSHGAFGTRKSNETLFRELASHGYVVCAIDHAYHCLYTELEGGERVFIDGGYLGELKRENAKKDAQNSLSLYRKWMGVRVADINFVIDTVLLKSKRGPDGVYGLVDREKIGVIGHSLGGAAALGVGRARSDVGAVVALEAPFLCDITDVRDNAFVFESADYPAPLLSVYSDSSWGNLQKWPQYAENARLLSGGDKDAYNLHIAGAGHLSLTDLSLSSPLLTRVLNGRPASLGAKECLRALNEKCLSFFDCFLKGEGVFQG